MTNKCFSYEELIRIPTKDNQEPLVNLVDHCPNQLLLGMPSERSKEYVSYGMWVRKGVAQKLIEAEESLGKINTNYKLKVCYAYRHPEVQKKYFNDFYEKTKLEKANFSESQLLEHVHHFIAIPKVAGHPAGAAVDLLIYDLINNSALDFGGNIGDFSNLELVVTFSNKISDTQKQNRMLLREVMTKAGFAPYDFEWWHFSYGDREWACYYQKQEAVYEQIDFRC